MPMKAKKVKTRKRKHMSVGHSDEEESSDEVEDEEENSDNAEDENSEEEEEEEEGADGNDGGGDVALNSHVVWSMEGDIPVCTFPAFHKSTKTAADGKSTTVIDTADQDVSLAFESHDALKDAMLAALDAVSRAVAKKKKEIMGGVLRLVTNGETKVANEVSQASQPTAAVQVPSLSPGTSDDSPTKKRAAATGSPTGALDPKQLKMATVEVSQPSDLDLKELEIVSA
jgi:hypothetical protein